MKRFLALAALVLGLASCQTEPEGLDVIVGGEVESFVTVSITETTRATSAHSGLTNVNPDDYDLRYILEVYDKENDVFVYRDVQTVETSVKSVSFPVRLIPERDYNFVVWADFVTNDSEDDLYYTTTKGLDEVSIITSEWVQMNEARDAYTGNEIVTGYNSGKSINITLTRPFGKLRVITTDIDALNELNDQPMPESITVNYTNKVYTAFNALIQKPIPTTESTKDYTYELANVYKEDWTTENRTLFTDYIFGTASGSIQFTMEVVMTNDNVVQNNFNTEIPVKRNYLTTITGDILTDGNNIKVDVSDGFENAGGTDPDYELSTISSAAELIDAINGQGGEYIVVSDIVVTGNSASTLAATRATANEPTTNEPTTATIDLNGYTIKLKADIVVEAGKNIIITDTNENGEGGAIISENGGAIVNNGNLNIEGGHFGENTIKNNNGEVNITGGTFESNPSDFVDDDYIVVEGEDGVCTIERKPQDLIDFESAIAQGGDVTLTKDITLLETVVIKADNTVNLNLNGKTLTATNYAIENYGTLTINGDGTINGVVYGENGTTTVENGTFNPADGGAYVFLNSQGGTLTINGGTINGGSSYPIYSYDENSRLVINDVTVNATFGCVNAYGTNGSVVINGGTYKMTGVEGKTSHITYFSSNIVATINGGTFEKIGDISMSATGGGGICVNGGANLTINGGTFAGDYDDVYNYGGTISVMGGEYKFKPDFVADGYKVVENNGRWAVVVDPVAKIGDVEYKTLEAAVAAAEEGATITLLKDVTLAEELALPAGVTFNGNGKQINGTIYAGGNLTFTGHTKVTAFSASYYNRVITIGEGACLEVTGGGRVTLGYGNTFNIIGSIEDAKTADKAEISPSLIIPAGISITGGNNAAMNVTNAYVQIGSTTSKPGVANGEFTLNFTNAIAEFTKEVGFYDPTGGVNPTFVMNIENSVFTTGTKLYVTANSEVKVDNSVVTLGTYFHNSGKFDLANGSVMTGSTIQFGENGGNNGTITVDNSSFSINCGNSTGHAFDGKGTGSITATNGATVAVQYYKDMTINVDATSTFTGTDIYGNRKIHYVSEEMKLEPTNPDALGGATIVSNVWDKTTGKGVITFDRDLTTIGDKAFQRVTNTTPSNWATSITLPASVTSIGDYAFAQCYSLTTITIPDGVTTIGQYAFQSCDAVTTVTIGSRVSTIGSGAFYNCYEIKEFNCKSATPPALADKWVFNGVEKTATVYVPAASVDTYKAAWSMFADKIVAGEF